MAIELVNLQHDEVIGMANDDDRKAFILTQLAVTFSDDRDFLTKVNKLTFGLISKQ